MFGGQLRQHRHQSLVERRRVQVGQQHDECAPPEPALHRRDRRRQHRIRRARAAAAPSRRPDAPAARCATRCRRRRGCTRSWAMKSTWSPARDAKRGQQQCGVHRPVQPRPAARVGRGRVDADAARRRASGVEHDDDPTVAFGPPGPDHDIGAARGGPPVDRAHVVAHDILAQRVELGALPADQQRAACRRARAAGPAATADACATGTAAGPGSATARGANAAGRPGPAARSSARSPRPTRWSPRRTRSQRRCRPECVVPQRGRRRACAARRARCGGQASRSWPRNRRPTGVVDHQTGVDLLAEPGGRVAGRAERQRAGAGGQRRRRQPPPAPAPPASTAKAVAGQARSTIGRTADQRHSPARPVRITSAAPEPRPGSRRARRRGSRLRARPPAAARPGAAASGGPWP